MIKQIMEVLAARNVCLLILVLPLSACEVFRTSFGETAREMNGEERIFRLDLSDQSLILLPPEIGADSTISMLDLSGNIELDIEQALSQVCKLPELRILKLNRLNLSSLPENIKACKHLRQLSLAHNPNLDIAGLVLSLSNLDLQFLDLSNNHLTDLPPELGRLQLRDIRLSYNLLGSAADFRVLGQNSNLFAVWLDNNQISHLPPEISALKSVGYLYLDHNRLRELPEELSDMPRLGGLWLGHNCFEKIPEELAYSGVLMAYLNNNKISKIPDAFKNGNVRLRGIVLDYNFLTEEQTDDLSRAFRHMFIYSDANQLTL